MRDNTSMAEVAPVFDQFNVTTHSVTDIIEKCNELFDDLFISPNESSWLYEEYSHCENCNITAEELDTLVSAGVCTSSDFSSYMPFIYQMYASIFVIALLGNSLVIYTVVTSRKMHTVTNLFIVNLAVGDLLIMVFCIPFSVASIIVLQYWPFGEGLCIFVNYFQAISIFVSAYTLVAISMDRYLAIIYPLRPRMTRLQAKLIIGVVWTLALLTTLPIAVFSGLEVPDSRIYRMYEKEVCMEMWPNDELKKYYTMALMMLQYFLPLLVMIFTYSRIGWEVWGRKKPTTANKGENSLGAQSLDTGRRLLRKNTTDHSPAKMIRMTLTVVLVYSLCWLPFNLLITTTDFYSEVVYWPHFHHLWFVFHWLAMSHTCYNPLILCWMNAKFREGYLNVLYHILPCCRPRISEWLLKVRQSSGMHRAHTYSTAFGSSRTSRNQRSNDDSRVRRDSACSNTVFMQVPHTAEYPLKVFRGYPCETTSNGVNGKDDRQQVHKYSDDPAIRSPSYNNLNPTVATTLQNTNTLPRMSYLEVSSSLCLDGPSSLSDSPKL